MDFLISIDTAVFNFCNQTLSNPVFDQLMPFLSGNKLFIPGAAVLAAFLVWKFKARGVLCVLFSLIAVGIGDGWIISAIKHGVARARPFNDIETAITLVGRTGSYSFPSAHSANVFAVAMVFFVYFRQSWKIALPLAFGIAFSRVYNGVHYPSDTITGAVLGAGYGLAFVWVGNEAWNWGGRKWFPLWWARLPNLIDPEQRVTSSQLSVNSGQTGGGEDSISTDNSEDSKKSLEGQWLRLGYVLVALLFIGRLAYLGAEKIELSEDEAYQWQWSQHLALSYFSKPPLIAYTQALGTSIWGDNAFGVRFFAPVIGAVLAFLLLRFFAAQRMARFGFWLILILSATPLPAVGTILMVIDSLSVLFWAAAMLSGWKAIEKDSTAHWLWTGLWLAMGFLAKYTALFQLVSFVLFFLLWPPARRQFARKGFWLGMGVMALGFIPVVAWNAQNDWITVTHLGSRAGLEQEWIYNWNFMQDFVLGELALLNPIFFIAMVWASFAVWRKHRDDKLLLYLLCMGAPLFLGYFLYTIRSRVQPNWIAPAIVPLFCVMAIYWGRRFEAGTVAVKRWLTAGLILGLPLVILLHDTNIVSKVLGYTLPVKLDPLVRVRGWSETARIVEEERKQLASEGKPVFVIGSHYGITSVVAFYIPEANATAGSDKPLVYYQAAEHPENQFYFWPGYSGRKGENAIYIQRIKLNSNVEPPPERIREQFESIEDLGVSDVVYRGRVIHRVRMVACRNLL